MFRQYDDDGNKKLSYEEFRKGVREYGCGSDEISDEQMKKLFRYFDKDGSGQVNFDELLAGIRVSLN